MREIDIRMRDIRRARFIRLDMLEKSIRTTTGFVLSEKRLNGRDKPISMKESV